MSHKPVEASAASDAIGSDSVCCRFRHKYVYQQTWTQYCASSHCNAVQITATLRGMEFWDDSYTTSLDVS